MSSLESTTGESALVQVDWPMAGCARITLNRPQAMNALSSALRRALVVELRRLAADRGARVLVVTGAGKAFCAGLDLGEVGEHGVQALLGATRDAAEDVIAALLGFPGPVIGAINGAAVTGGFELALACDVLIASNDAWFCDTHARVGVVPGWGLSQRLSRRIGPARAKAVSLTACRLDARTAERWGLVERTVEAGALAGEALRVAGEMLAMQPAMLPVYKRIIEAGFAMDLEAALRFERDEFLAWTEEIAAGRAALDATLPAGRSTPSEAPTERSTQSEAPTERFT